jgi:hypothetical protein
MWRFFGGRTVVTADASAPVVRSVVVALGLMLAMLALVSLAPAGRAEAAPALRAGGPDDFGYTFKDSSEPGGPSYAWEDIAATGTLVTGWNSYDNGFAGPIPIGFNFEFYGVSYNQLYVGSNGFVSFGAGFSSIPASYPLPDLGDPNNMIALFGGDLYLHDYGQNSAVRYQTLGNPTRLIVQFDRLSWCCNAGAEHTFQMALYPNGDIEARYKQLSNSTPRVVGIENANGSVGLNYGNALDNGLAIRYSYPTGVLLMPPEQDNFGRRGAEIRYSVRVTNHTGSPDSFELAVQSGNDWPTTLSISQTGTLADGASMQFDAWVTIPAGAAVGDIGQSTIEATSATSPTVRAAATLSTTAASDEIAYITMSENGLVTLVDTTLYTVLGAVDVGAAGCRGPWQATITPAGDQVYVSCSSSDNVVVIDTNDHRIVGVRPGIAGPSDIGFTPDGSHALVGVGSFNRIATIDTQTLALGSINTPWSTRNIAVHPYLPRAYVTGDSSTLLVVDTASLILAQPIHLGFLIDDVAVSADGRYLFASHAQSDRMTVIDALDHSVVAVVHGVSDLGRLEVVLDGSAIYGAAQWNGVYVIDGYTFERIAAITIQDRATYLAIACSGGNLWVSGSYNTVSVIDTEYNQVLQALTLSGYSAAGMAICPQRVVEDLLLLPPDQSKAGALGDVVTHELVVINATGAADSFTLALGASNWPATLSTTTTGLLAPGQRATVQVQVAIPAGAAWYDSDAVQVTATGVGDPAFSATVTVTTLADAPPSLSVAPTALSSTQEVGQVVDQALLISNGNGVTLTVAISDIDQTPGRTPLAQILSGRVYTTTIDNEDNALSGNPDGDMDTDICSYYSNAPIEFNIFVDRPPGRTGNVLTVRARDSYGSTGTDQVRLNGVTLGVLANSTYQWSDTAFNIPPGVVVYGANLVQVIIGNNRCIQVDRGELLVAGSPAAWLQQTPSSASLPANSSQNVVVTFDSTGVQPGTHQATVVLESNDPVQPTLAVPVTMTVQPTADMGSVAGAITDAWTGQPLTATVELVGVHTLTGRTDYQIWALAGAYELVVGASGYVTATTPVVIAAGGATAQDVALEPTQARLEWLPLAVEASVEPGGQIARTLMISNTGPLPLDLALFEINLDVAEAAPTPEDLSGKRILYDRSHGQPARGEYSTLINDAIAAGAVVVDNWYFPVDASVLQGYDILWSNCCGSMTWGWSELQAVEQWMRRGGAVLVHGSDSPATAGLASISGIFYFSDSCAYGTTTNITPHPISAGVTSVYYNFGVCQRLSASPGATVVVFDTFDRPNVVAQEANGGKMAVFASPLFSNSTIDSADHRLLGNNTLGWLARPAYADVPWLSVSPASGVVPGHSSLPVTATFDATGLSTGVYQARLAMEHNDPDQEFPVEVPVTLFVGVPTAITLNDLASASQPASAPLGALPVAALPAVAMAVLALAAWRSRQR